jgi:phage major head subunit gpT-like protein
MELRGNWGDLIAGVGLELDEVFNQAQEEYQPGIFALLNRVTGSGAVRNVTGKTGVGKIHLFDDGDDVPQNVRTKTYTTRIVYNNYGGYLEVSKNTIEDRDFAEIFDETRELGLGANISQDESGMQLFNGGFSTTILVNGYNMSFYGDGNPTFSTVHSTPVQGGTTNSNASSTSLPFAFQNLETGYLALLTQHTDDGIPVSLMGKPTLVVAPFNMKKAQEITQAEEDPSTANRNINVYVKGMSTDMAMSLYLATTNSGNDNAWFLCVPSRHKLNFEVRQEPRFEQANSVKNLSATFVCSARWANSVTDWRRTWGSQGTNATYSS